MGNSFTISPNAAETIIRALSDKPSPPKGSLLLAYRATRSWRRLQELHLIASGKPTEREVVSQKLKQANAQSAYLTSVAASCAQFAYLNNDGRERMLASLTKYTLDGKTASPFTPLLLSYQSALRLGSKQTAQKLRVLQMLDDEDVTSARLNSTPVFDSLSSRLFWLSRLGVRQLVTALRLPDPPDLARIAMTSKGDVGQAMDGAMCGAIGKTAGTIAAGAIELAAYTGAPETFGTSLTLAVVAGEVGIGTDYFVDFACNAIVDEVHKHSSGGEGAAGKDKSGARQSDSAQKGSSSSQGSSSQQQTQQNQGEGRESSSGSTSSEAGDYEESGDDDKRYAYPNPEESGLDVIEIDACKRAVQLASHPSSLHRIQKQAAARGDRFAEVATATSIPAKSIWARSLGRAGNAGRVRTPRSNPEAQLVLRIPHGVPKVTVRPAAGGGHQILVSGRRISQLSRPSTR